ncbi:hypothetical protein GA0115252_124053 [Streptomyces sp. DfronAA-171]|nr:hypothetical protein GA0115252_124053 [Streptomyces sp. DfronAA-171]
MGLLGDSEGDRPGERARSRLRSELPCGPEKNGRAQELRNGLSGRGARHGTTGSAVEAPAPARRAQRPRRPAPQEAAPGPLTGARPYSWLLSRFVSSYFDAIAFHSPEACSFALVAWPLARSPALRWFVERAWPPGQPPCFAVWSAQAA